MTTITITITINEKNDNDTIMLTPPPPPPRSPHPPPFGGPNTAPASIAARSRHGRQTRQTADTRHSKTQQDTASTHHTQNATQNFQQSAVLAKPADLLPMSGTRAGEGALLDRGKW